MDTIDPYVKTTYDGKEDRTKEISNNENPEFNEDLTYKVVKDVKKMKIQIMDANSVTSDSEAASVMIDLS
jgi:Ca2+-dependent lipid-binding protein